MYGVIECRNVVNESLCYNNIWCCALPMSSAVLMVCTIMPGIVSLVSSVLMHEHISKGFAKFLYHISGVLELR